MYPFSLVIYVLKENSRSRPGRFGYQPVNERMSRPYSDTTRLASSEVDFTISIWRQTRFSATDESRPI